jgi:hypothetical protein
VQRQVEIAAKRQKKAIHKGIFRQRSSSPKAATGYQDLAALDMVIEQASGDFPVQDFHPFLTRTMPSSISSGHRPASEEQPKPSC